MSLGQRRRDHADGSLPVAWLVNQVPVLAAAATPRDLGACFEAGFDFDEVGEFVTEGSSSLLRWPSPARCRCCWGVCFFFCELSGSQLLDLAASYVVAGVGRRVQSKGLELAIECAFQRRCGCEGLG